MTTGTAIGILLAIIGIFATIYFGIQYKINKQKITWSKVLGYIEKLAEKLKTEDWIPEVLVSFPKGGLIVADLLGHQFDNELDIVSIYTKRVRENDTIKVYLRHPYVNFNALIGKRILLIDDMISCGDTMKIVKKLLDNIDNADIRTAVLGITEPTYFIPNYSFFNYNQNEDIFLPWGKLTL